MRTVRYISAIWLEFTYLRTFICVTCGFGKKARRDFGLRIGRTRRTHHHQGPQGGRDAPADGGPLPRADQKIVRGVGYVVRHLFEDFVQDPRRDGVGLFPETLRLRQVHRKDINAVLRRGGADLPGRPLHRGDLSQLLHDRAYGDQCEKCGSTLRPTELIDPKSAMSGSCP